MQAAAERIVTAIPASVSRFTSIPLINGRKKRVAGYARVSTDEEEQQTSYEAQVDYYTRFIKENAAWEYVDVYTDEGISAVNTKKREGFKNMIADALDGKIDLIVTKSVSRFARNTVDTLTTVRKLKEKGVEVFFEKENIYTLDSKGELLITIMSSLAQEESRSISENTTWGKRKQFADGVICLPYKHFLGYEKGDDGLPKIVESEAKTVRLIYALYLQGKTHNTIARYLTENGILTPAKKTKWSISTVMSILQNEKYKGDAMLQKNFTVDFLTKEVKRNEGEVPQFYVENSHPAIIKPEIFDLVQAEIKKRKLLGTRQSGIHCFSGKIICGACGELYGSKVWHSTSSKYRRVIWQCNHKYKNNDKCGTPHLYETDIQRVFIKAFNMMFAGKERLIQDYGAVLQVVTDTSALDRESKTLRDECAVVTELIQKGVNENARTAQDQSEYNKQFNALVGRYETAKSRLDSIMEEKQARTCKRDTITKFLSDLGRRDGLLEEFDEGLWYETVEKVTVISEQEATVTFKDGSDVCVNISEV